MQNSQGVLNSLKNFFSDKYCKIKLYECESEPKLLEKLNIASQLQLQKDTQSGPGLFGKNSLKSDYRPQNCKSILIEFKKIGLKTGKGKNNKNEHDIKNALAQIVEQAYCKKVPYAILAIIDGGEANDREWNDCEKAYINMFKSNSLCINLSVLRIRIDTGSERLYFETV